MKPYKILLFVLLSMGVLTMAFLGCQKEAQKNPSVASVAKVAGPNDRASKGAGAYDTLTLTCAGGTQTTLALNVTAGASGAPAGFTIQWVSKVALDGNNGVWPDALACEASLSGTPYGGGVNVYNLPANGTVTVYIGDLLNAQLNQQLGLSTSCSGALTCGTQYVFRAFAHANSAGKKSDFSYLNTSCATTASCGGGTTK